MASRVDLRSGDRRAPIAGIVLVARGDESDPAHDGESPQSERLRILLDGLAGGICILSFCCTGYIAYLGGDTVIGYPTVAENCVIGLLFGYFPDHFTGNFIIEARHQVSVSYTKHFFSADDYFFDFAGQEHA